MEGNRERGMVESMDLSLRESFEIYNGYRTKYDAFAKEMEPYLNDPTISEGSKAAIRTSLNAALACGDLSLSLGLPFTFSATALKGVSKLDVFLKWAHKTFSGKKDGDATSLKKYDLTPEVKLRTSVLFQILELCSGGFLPMRTIEGIMQMNKDIPRIWAAYKRIREIAAAKATIAPDVQNAIDVFQPDGGTV